MRLFSIVKTALWREERYDNRLILLITHSSGCYILQNGLLIHISFSALTLSSNSIYHKLNRDTKYLFMFWMIYLYTLFIITVLINRNHQLSITFLLTHFVPK